MLANLAQVVFVAYVLMQFMQAIVKPLTEIVNLALAGGAWKEKVLSLWPLYVTAAVAGTLGWFTRYNLLPMFEPEAIGRVLTCIGIGLGPSFLYDLQDNAGEVIEEIAYDPDPPGTQRFVPMFGVNAGQEPCQYQDNDGIWHDCGCSDSHCCDCGDKTET